MIKKKIVMIICAIILLGIVTYNVFLKGLFGDEKSQIEFWAGNAVSGEQLSNVSATFMQGRNNMEGESFCQVDINTNDKISVELPYGEYTVKWSADGYNTYYQNVEVLEKETFVRGWLIPVFEENAAYVLVEWETETDLDLCAYNEQTGRCIGKETTLEDAGSFSYGDNSGAKGYEMVFLQDYDKNAYRIYVKDNKNSVKEQSLNEETVSATVSIYTSSGLLYQKESEDIKGITLWHCADISGGRIKEWDEYILDLGEYAWAARDKDNPDFWIENADIKAEEKYEYSGGLYRLEIKKFDLNGNQTAYFRYRTDGKMTYGDEDEYDEDGNLLISYTYEYEEGELLVSKDEYFYDEKGNRTGWLAYDSDGELHSSVEMEYDEEGNQILYTYYDGDGKLITREEYTYDRNGNELSHFLYGVDGLYSRYETEYDDNGNKTACYVYDESGLLEFKTEHEYDQNGNYISGRTYDEQGRLSSRMEYEYDENGNVMAGYSYDGNGVLRGKYEYDIHGNQTAIYAYEDGVLILQHISVFDENENPIEYYEYRDGKLRTKIMREFNENGECTLICVYNGNGSLESRTTYDYVYEYDAIGGMKIFYYYVDDVLTTKTITLFY